MKTSISIKKILMLCLWVVVIGGIITLLVAANRKQADHTCRNILVSIKGHASYIDEKAVKTELNMGPDGQLHGLPIKSIHLALLEKQLEDQDWINDAQLYFDKDNDLHVLLSERIPVARVFTVSGKSFYIDSSGRKLPLLDKPGLRLPVITGFTDATRWNAEDSAMSMQLRKAVSIISKDSFWSAQVGQIDINESRQLDIIPTVGDHIIRIGTADNLEDKLARLLVFYKQVLSKTGFNKYSLLNVTYNNQVVAVKKGPVSAVDSLQLQKNIEDLLTKNTLEHITNDMMPGPGAQASDTAHFVSNEMSVSPEVNNSKPEKPIQELSKPHQGSGIENRAPVQNKRIPKAVMPGNGNKH